MKKTFNIIYIFTIIGSLSALCSCTQNDGKIGDLFGLWALNDFYSDDVHLTGEQCAGYSLKFQSGLVQYVENLPFHDSNLFIGTWRISADSLFLNFPYGIETDELQDIDNYPGDEDSVKVVFSISPSIGYKIHTLSSSVLDISRTTSDNIELRYYFSKLN